MKLRNKRTGDIWEFNSISMDISIKTLDKLKASSGTCYAGSIAELNDEWEDYNPNESLIITPAQKDKILHTLDSGSYDPYEWIPTVNFILSVLGSDDKIEHDDFENPRWSSQ